MSAVSGQNVSVDFATADGTATAPADYTATNGTLTFTPGQTTKTVTVPVKGDLLDEANETYFVNLTNPSNATISDAQGLGTITDDDPLPALSIDDVTVAEGNSGTVSATFTVTLAPRQRPPVTVDYATADGTAQAPGDYQACERIAHVHGRPDDEAGDRPRQRRPSRRGGRELHPQPDQPDECDARRRAGRGHDHRRRPAAVARGRRRDGHRGRSGTTNANFTVSLNAPSGGP